jgi:hypothetical protein
MPRNFTADDVGHYIRHKPTGLCGLIEHDPVMDCFYPDIPGVDRCWVSEDFEFVTVEVRRDAPH